MTLFGLLPTISRCVSRTSGSLSMSNNFSRSFNSTFRKNIKLAPFQSQVQLRPHSTFKFQNAAKSGTVNGKKPVVSTLPSRTFRTSAPRKALAPFIVAVVLLSFFAKFGGAFLGRRVGSWWRKLLPEEKAEYSKKIKSNQNAIWGSVGALAFGSFLYYNRHVEEAPVTKRRRFLTFSEKQMEELDEYELEIGRFFLNKYKSQIIPESMNSPSFRRVVDVAERLIKANVDLKQIRDKEWMITVVHNDYECKAIVFSTGSIFVFSGLLKLCESDDELGVALGHEMAYTVMRHGELSLGHFMDTVLVIPLAAVWAIVPTIIRAAVGSLIVNKISKVAVESSHSRFIYHEADQVGLILAAKACFDIRVAPVLREKAVMAYGEVPIEWLSDRPSNENRRSHLTELLPAALSVREQCQCPSLPRFDPKLKLQEFEKLIQEKKRAKLEGLMVPVKP